jgi:heme A synthase
VALLITLALTFYSRKFPEGHRVRRAALAAGIFIVIEALIGAGLVVFDLVGGNTSITRAFAAAIHLSNTYLLLAAITLTAVWAHTDRSEYQILGSLRWGLILIAGLGMIVIGATGAVTALGDTLFPLNSLGQGIRQDFDPSAHFLIRLRVIHPILAITVGAYAFFGVRLWWFISSKEADRYGSVLIAMIVIQWIAGAFNVLLLAPIWMQIVHLLIADLVWIVFILDIERGIFKTSTSENMG